VYIRKIIKFPTAVFLTIFLLANKFCSLFPSTRTIKAFAGYPDKMSENILAPALLGVA
jgi:hypothetical protein